MTSSALAQRNGTSGITWTAEQKNLIKKVIAPGCTDDELRLFAHHCHRTGLDPFSKQIYAIKRGGKLTIQVSIDGLRSIAERTGELSGSQKFWCGPDGEWKDVWLSDKPPSAAKAIIYRKGAEHPFVGIALDRDYNAKQSLWLKMPSTMLAKCAEAQALRAGFPADLSGLYATEEMDQAGQGDALSTADRLAAAGEEVIDAQVVEPEVVAPAPEPTPAPRTAPKAAKPAVATKPAPAAPVAEEAPATEPTISPEELKRLQSVETLAKALGALNATGRKALLIAYSGVAGFQEVTSIDEFLEVASAAPDSHINGLTPKVIESLNKGLNPRSGAVLTPVIEDATPSSVDVDDQPADGKDDINPLG